MGETLNIAGYCRISVDDELDRDNVSIENQKAIIRDFVGHKFPGAELVFYEDRDRSGYTFEQREGYQAMRRELMAHRLDILVIKDFSRFSRRNSRGLVELEDLRDAGVRIISIGDGIDFPNDDDWLKIQFQFLINEMPVTDTSKKVKSVIRRRQEDGRWICAAPYGYIVNKKQQFEVVPVEADIVRRIYRLYIDGWGYKKIANTLTDEGIPTPRMAERERKIAEGEDYRRSVKSAWSIATVQGILDNDFYIGTLRQGKYTRRKINGKDVRRDEDEQIVIENHHQAIVDYRTFATTRALREKRSTSHYRGVKKYDNTYSGFLVCGDCGAPMFSLSRGDLKSAYTCGTYHRRGLKGCTSHHIRADKLDELLKAYVRQVMDHSADMLERLNADLAREQEDVAETEQSADRLAEVLSDLQEELKVTKRQRIRDLMKHPDQEDILEQTYDELEGDLQRRIEGIGHQIELLSDKRNAQKVAFMFDAIDNSDYAFRYATRGRSSNDKLVSESLNRITQILSNFINNAIKFTESGYIHVGYTLSEKYIRFHVQDSGIGISTKNQEQIFDRFIKLNTFARGTGLGLSICKSIVEKLGGEIGVKSTLGCGSTFWFSLPYDPLYKAKSGATGH